MQGLVHQFLRGLGNSYDPLSLTLLLKRRMLALGDKLHQSVCTPEIARSFINQKESCQHCSIICFTRLIVNRGPTRD